MLDIMQIYNHYTSRGISAADLHLSRWDMSPDFRTKTNHLASNAVLNAYTFLSSLFRKPYQAGEREDNVLWYMQISQRRSIDLYKQTITEHISYFRAPSWKTTSIAFDVYDFKTINAEARKELKEFVLAQGGELIPTLYMVTNPGCEIAVYKVAPNKFIVLTNTISDEIFEGLIAMLCLNASDSVATPEIANAIITGNTEVVKQAVFSILNGMLEQLEQQKFGEFTNTLKRLLTDEHLKESLENKLQNIQAEIERRESDLRSLFSKEKTYRTQLLGDLSGLNEENFSDLLTMLNYKMITKYNTDRYGNLYINLVSTLLYWDKDDYVTLRDNRRRHGNDLSQYSEEFIGFLDKILETGEYTLLFTTPLKLFTSRNADDRPGVVSVMRGNTADTYGVVSNPHIYHYDCWGDNKPLIDKAFKNKDYVSAWGGICSALSGVNISDTPVFRKLIYDLYSYATGREDNRGNSIKLPDGTVCSTREAYANYLANRVTAAQAQNNTTEQEVNEL